MKTIKQFIDKQKLWFIQKKWLKIDKLQAKFIWVTLGVKKKVDSIIRWFSLWISFINHEVTDELIYISPKPSGWIFQDKVALTNLVQVMINSKHFSFSTLASFDLYIWHLSFVSPHIYDKFSVYSVDFWTTHSLVGFYAYELKQNKFNQQFKLTVV